MKALTLWQPFASLMAFGLKQNETRSWDTSFRGPLVITAAKRKIPVDELEYYRAFECFRKAEKIIGDLEKLPLGAALCTVMLNNVRPTAEAETLASPMELAFGNYTPGRFAWETSEVERFPRPLPCRGFQQLWEVDLRELRAQAAREGR